MMLFVIILGLCLAVPAVFTVKNKKVRYIFLAIILSIALFAFGYQMGSDRATIDKKELKK